MAKYFIQPTEPSEIAERFSNEKSLEPLPEMDEDWKESRLEEIKSTLDYLPDTEADFVRLYYFRDKKQMDIAKIFDVTQAAVSYRLQRAKQRLQFLIDMPDLDKHEVYDRLIEIFSDRDAKIFREMYETSCQTAVAERLGFGQGCVRHRFLQNLRRLGRIFAERVDAWVRSKSDADTTLFMERISDRVDHVLSQKDDMDEESIQRELMDVVQALRDRRDEEDQEQENDVQDAPLDLGLIYRSFVRIRHNFNILKEVELPKWNQDPSKKIS